MERNKLWASLIAVLLLVGLGVWLLRPSASDDRTVDDPDPSALDGDPRAHAGKTPRRASSKPELAAKPRAAISGTVRDHKGRAIADAQVCVWPRIGELDGLAPGHPRCTQSGSDGHYRLEQLLPVRVVVNAEARGYLPQRWFARHPTHRETELQLHAGQTREGVDFVLREGGTAIEGVVRDISGGIVEGAFVWVGANDFQDPGRSAAISDAEGRFTLWSAPGRIILYAEAEGYANAERYSIAPGSSVELVLTPESVITGKVVLAGTGEPVAGVVVDAKAESFFSEGSGQARSDEAGEFRIDRLEHGLYTLRARGDELYGQATELVHLGLAQTAENVVIELHPALLVSGRVVIAGGLEPRPCEQGWVRLNDRNDKRNRRSTRFGADGEVEIRSVLPGNYEVDVRCDGMVPELEYPDLELRDASRSGLIWEVREGLTIRGEIVDAQGSPVEGQQALASMKVDPDAPPKHMTRALSDPTLDDGRFTAAGLLPGTYEVSLLGFDRFADVESVTVVLEPGADVHDVRLVLPELGAIAGIVRDADGQPVAGVGLRASSSDHQSGGVAMSDDGGRFLIEDLALGEVRILAMDAYAILRKPGSRDDDEQGTLAQVRAGETTEVEIMIEARRASLRGRVLDEHGSPVADAFVSYQRMPESATAAKGQARSQLRRRFEERPVLTEADGTFVLEGLAADASYVVGAFRKGGGEAVLEGARPGEAIELTIIATGEIAGKVVTTSGGAPPERRKVTISNEAEGLRRDDELFRSNGTFRLKELPAGTYTLIVDSSIGTARVEGIELAPGEAKVDIVVPLTPRVTVRGRLVDIDTRAPVPGMSVSVGPRGTSMSFWAEKGGDLPHISDADGRFEVANALVGKVLLAISARSFADDSPYATWTYYQIPSGEGVVDIGEIELVAARVDPKQKPGDPGFELAPDQPEIEPEDQIPTVAIIRPRGPADGSGLEVGDQIETVAGHDVRGTNSVRLRRLIGVPAGQSFQLGIVGGKTVTITAGPPTK
jgi:hypothetical protein